MKISQLITSLFVASTFALVANGKPSGGCCASSGSELSAVANTVNDYPLDTCVVSGEKLGAMGAPIDYVHKEAGKPDRLVRFCCKMCIGKFKKDPAKYLKLIDEAAAQKKKG